MKQKSSISCVFMLFRLYVCGLADDMFFKSLSTIFNTRIVIVFVSTFRSNKISKTY